MLGAARSNSKLFRAVWREQEKSPGSLWALRTVETRVAYVKHLPLETPGARFI